MLAISDRVAILRKGRYIDAVDTKSATEESLTEMMVGEKAELNIERPRVKDKKLRLRVEHLSCYNTDGIRVLDDVSFEAYGGEILGIAGVSGNGQNELADAIAGLIKNAEGKIFLNGVDITDFPIRRRIEEGIAYIPEDRHNVGLVLGFMLKDNLVIKNYYDAVFSNKGIINESALIDNGSRLIEKYDIRSSKGNSTVVSSMSGGNQQKAIIAREIEMNGKLIIFMQPTRGLDVGAISNIHKQIVEERDRGAAVLLISLELDEVMNLADTIGVIFDGSITRIARASELSMNEVGEYMAGVGKAEK